LGEIAEAKEQENDEVDIFGQKLSDNKKMIFKTSVYYAIMNSLI
jgi:hypothetical protein